MNSIDSGIGTRFGKAAHVRIKLSDKDLVLIAGIAVAVIIAITILLKDALPHMENTQQQVTPAVKQFPSPSVFVNKVGKSIFTVLSR